MGDRKQIDFPFPLKGKHEGAAYRKQPEGTTPDALNVRAFDSIANRLRGGQRNGLSKYVAGVVNGSNPIQSISQLTTAFDPTNIVPDALLGGDTFTYTDGFLGDGSRGGALWDCWESAQIGSPHEENTLTFTPSIARPLVASGTCSGNFGADNYIAAAIHKTVNTGINYLIQFTFRYSAPSPGAAQTRPRIAILFRVQTALGVSWPTAFQGHGWAGMETTSAGHVLLVLRAGSETADSYDLTSPPSGPSIADAAWKAATHTLKLTVVGNLMRLYVDNTLYVTHSSSVNSTQSRWGFEVGDGQVSATSLYIDSLTIYSGTVPASLRSTQLMAVSGGNIYQGSSLGLTIPTGGTNALIGSGIVRMQQAFGQMYFVDGVHYKVYDPVAGAVTAWTPTVGSLPAGIADVVTYPITTVDVTTSKFIVTGDLTGLITTGDIIVVSGDTASPSNNGYYRVTGRTYGASTTLLVSPAPLTSGVPTPGSPILSKAQRTATIIALYRGRIVLSGLASDPQNWFMSKAGDPLDWNYTPTTLTQTMAVAGNNSQVGLMGDVITCLAPYNDDMMFMGGDHTLWIMRGDPAAGGLIDNISYSTGIVGPDAWARSPDGDFYFFGAGTFWMIPSGSTVPQPLSRGVLDLTFGAIDYATFQVRLLWDDWQKGVHLYFTPANQPTTAPIHYFWDKRAGGFWPDQYPIVCGPTAVWLYDADLPTDRAFLLGGFDSYIRQIPATLQKDDDGTVIHSYVRYPPHLEAGDLGNARLSELVAITSATSDPVVLKVYAEDTAEDAAVATDVQVAKVLPGYPNAGRHGTMRQRITGNAIALDLESSAPAWVTATYYAAGIQVMAGGVLYTCLLPHTSTVGGAHPTPPGNVVDWAAGTTRAWAIESITGIMDVSGKTRHRRL